MKVTRMIAMLGVVALATSACAETEPDTGFDEVPPATETTPGTETTPDATATAPDEMPEHTVAMEPVGGSMLTGQVEIDDDNGNTGIDVQVEGSTEGAVHQGHIHTGSCEAPGAVVQPLQPVTIGDDGEGTSENDLQLAYTTVTDGQHIVVFHQAGGNPGAPALCVAIPSHEGM